MFFLEAEDIQVYIFINFSIERRINKYGRVKRMGRWGEWGVKKTKPT